MTKRGMTKKPTLENLPTEMHMAIMSHLPWRDVATTRGVSRTLKTAANIVSNLRLEKGKAAVLQAREAVTNKAAVLIWSMMRALLKKLQRRNWRFVNEETNLRQRGVELQAPFPMLGDGFRMYVSLTHDHEDDILEASRFGRRPTPLMYDVHIVISKQGTGQWESVVIQFWFQGNELKAEIANWSTFHPTSWLQKAAQLVVDWYSKDPFRK